MKRPSRFLILTIMCGLVLPVEAAVHGRGSTLEAIDRMSYAEASRHLPVAFEATVTYFRSYENLLFVEDGNLAIYVNATTPLALVPGDRVRVRGTTHESFRSYVQSSDITLLRHGPRPTPLPADFGQMIRGEVDCRLVRTRAVVRAADVVPNSIFLVPDISLELLVDGEQAGAMVDSADERAVKSLLDAEVEITGVVSGRFDNKMQQTGVLFHIQSLGDVKILRRAATDPWSLPVTRMDRVITGYSVDDRTKRMRVEGTITYYQPGRGLVLEDGSRSLWIRSETYEPLRIGDRAEATGFPDVQDGFLTLTRSEVRDTLLPAPVVPAVSTWRDLAQGGNSNRGHTYDLVSLEGQVVTEVRQATQDEYVLAADGHLVSAIIHHPGNLSRIPLPPMKLVPVGARVRVTGICMLANADPFYGDVPFNILMRSFDDVEVVARPPWLNVGHLIALVMVLLALIVGVGTRAWQVERRMRRQTASVASIEQRRGQILEKINGSGPLEEILEEIVALVSFQLNGAACWCELNDGSHAGHCPESFSAGLRVERYPITAAFAPLLGTLFTVHRGSSEPAQAALARASGLIALAVETSRLHSDLVHRSEFDLLTDIHNRFSLERALDAAVETARQTGGIFGLVYVDLDEFKRVNDGYGHRTGDHYLQQAAQRMKRMLRPGDLLARLGGDEFAVLAAKVRSRAEAEEIALRLEKCFDDPFAIEDTVIPGSASVGVAMYPEDGATKDALLQCADAAMYTTKRQQQRTDGRATARDSAAMESVGGAMLRAR